MHVPRLHRAFIDPSFLGFLTYLLSFETNTALKITIKYRQARFRVAILKQLMLLDPYPQSALAQTAQEQKHLVILRVSRVFVRCVSRVLVRCVGIVEPQLSGLVWDHTK